MEHSKSSQSVCHSATSFKKYKAPSLTHYGDASKLTQASDPATDLFLQNGHHRSSGHHKK